MKATAIVIGCLLLCGCAGRQKPGTTRDGRGQMNTWIVESLHNESVDNAIISQRTMYPYHFAASSSALNNLGVRDLRVLAAHCRRYPGIDLNVRRGNASETLYQARVNTVAETLAAEGVAPESVRLSDGTPGGEGMPARRQELILQRADKPAGSGGESGAGLPASGGTN